MFRRCDIRPDEKAQTDYQRILPDALFGQTIQVSEDCISVGAMAKLIFQGHKKSWGRTACTPG